MDIKTLKNRKRSNIISTLKRKNLKLKKDITKHIKATVSPPEQEKHLLKLQKDISRCANFSLYGVDQDNDIKYFASVFCGSKVCFVCNYARQKRVRRKYFNWFALNPQLFLIQNPKTKIKKVVSQNRVSNFQAKGYEVAKKVNYDLMHLTLTVPHYLETGFQGEIYYYQKITDLFHHLRNECTAWNELVYGGEYGIETTRTAANGLHIHIHSLLFVKSCTQNRNKLHQVILEEWNKRTINKYSTRLTLDQKTKDLIKKSNRSIDDDFCSRLNPQGTTMISLETIYSFNERGEKVRETEFNSEAMLRAVLETIKYHFEPLAFDKEGKTFDLDLMKELLPVIYRKQLYRKFGAIHGDKALNIKKDATETTEEDFLDSIDLETGEIVNPVNYFICNPAFMFHNPANDNQIILSNLGKNKLKNIDAITTSGAINQMSQMVQASLKHNSNN